MVGILERTSISIFKDNNSISVNGLLPSTSICTSAWPTIPVGRSKTDLTLIDSWLNFSSMLLLIISVAFGFCQESTKIREDRLRETYDTEKIYPAIIIPPMASACKKPNCDATNTLKKPITEAEPSFIEFLASVFRESISYLFAIFLI